MLVPIRVENDDILETKKFPMQLSRKDSSVHGLLSSFNEMKERVDSALA